MATRAGRGHGSRDGLAGMEPYKPSLDWANEIPQSLLWTGKAWLITAVVTVMVLMERMVQTEMTVHRVPKVIEAPTVQWGQ